MKKRILTFIIKTFFKDNNGNIDLNDLDFRGFNVYIKKLKANNINNVEQEAVFYIYNIEQKAKLISNGWQKAEDILNDYQEAKSIDNKFQQADSINKTGQKFKKWNQN